MAFSDRLDDALVLAHSLHRLQTRKAGDIPYLGHLLGVASLVIDHGGTEDQVIAALLHDAGEDQGGESTIQVIRERFGDAVADVVVACSDTFEVPKPAWRKRKEDYLSHLRAAQPDVLLVSLADMVHNSTSIVREMRVLGAAALDKFRGGRAGTLWYYRELVEIFGERCPGPLEDQLARNSAEMEGLATRQTRICLGEDDPKRLPS